jgi:hypothetical protein
MNAFAFLFVLAAGLAFLYWESTTSQETGSDRWLGLGLQSGHIGTGDPARADQVREALAGLALVAAGSARRPSGPAAADLRARRPRSPGRT